MPQQQQKFVCLLVLVSLLLSHGADGKSAQELLDQAGRHEARGEDGQALYAYEAAWKEDPAAFGAEERLNYGALLADRGDMPRAIGHMQAAKEMGRFPPHVVSQVCLLYFFFLFMMIHDQNKSKSNNSTKTTHKHAHTHMLIFLASCS